MYLGLVTLYCLALPVLWSYAVNGPLVTWALPNFTSNFTGFLSLIQILFVAALSPLFAGLAAIIGWAIQKRTTPTPATI